MANRSKEASDDGIWRAGSRDGIPGRRVIYEYWDTELTYEKSWLAPYAPSVPVGRGL